MRPKTTLLVSLALTATALAATPALDDGTEASSPAPTQITAADVTRTGASAWNISGVVDYGGEAPKVLGTDPTGDAPPQGTGAAAPLGLDLVELRAYTPDGDEPITVLEWQSAGIDQLPPPETVRFYWQADLGIGGGWAFQAKTTDIISAANLGDGTEQAIIDNVSSYADAGVPSFRIRGNCGTVVAVNNCGHVAWVDGEFDFDDDVIRFFLPLDLPNALPLRPGATLAPVDGTWAYAAIQAAADIGNTRDTVVQEEPYTIPVRQATATLTDADGTVVTSAGLTVADDSSISGDLVAVDLAAGDYTLTIDACFAGNCDSTSTTVSVL